MSTAGTGWCCLSRDRDEDPDWEVKHTRSNVQLVQKHDAGRCLKDFYEVEDKVLGTGGFGTVKKCWLKNAEQMVRAVKEVKKSNIAKNNNLVQEEIKVLENLDHPCICRLLETFESDTSFFLVLEYIDGRELFDEIEETISQRKIFEESRAAGIMRQVFGALQYCHARKVLHRDLKPENIMVLAPTPLARSPREVPIKIIDFGLAVLSKKSGHKSAQAVGTLQYMAPEAQKGHYVAVSDLWSMGVILHVILLGCYPAKATRGESVPLLRQKSNVSEEGAELLRALLATDPNKRINAADAYKHRWTTQRGPGDAGFTSPAPTVCIADMSEAFMSFRKSAKLRQAALTACAAQISGQAIADLHEQFNNIDQDGSGHIDKEELVAAFLKQPPPGIEDVKTWAEELFDSVDMDGSGEIEFTEFQAAAMQKLGHESDQAIRAAFRVFDRSNTGEITSEDLQAVLQEAGDEVAELMAGFDANGDGVLSYDEFKVMICGTPKGGSPKGKRPSLVSPTSGGQKVE